ncbi:CgeB family protein [Occallatibacter riparius]|uniref:Glycosyltransferase n=1 Tax=Occallatibacter riparius TaxID=1002689 RepID=A0A9J7BVQ4_9BACT|nr:glycosyltransferase [Occallatibacter riparius]UWZ86948.1 glycosyltransferase [Occallatibacter riparius]
MKIFAFGSSIVSSYWNGAATYYRGCYKYLARRGHSVTFAEPDAYGRQQHRDSGDFSYVESVVYRPTIDVAAMLERAAEADVVVKHSGIGADDELLEALVSEMGAERPVFFWDVDSPATLARMRANAGDPFRQAVPKFDAILSYGGGPASRDGYLQFGARAYYSIYNGLDLETHHPVDPDAALRCDVAFLGNRLPDREARVEELFLRAAELASGASFILGGEGWGDKALPKNVRWIGHVPTDDHNRVNCSAGMVMNINRASMADSGFSPPTRVFEVAGAGACLLCDDWPGIDDCFEPGTEILVIRRAEDVVQALRKYDEKARKKIGTAFRERALRDHTYDLRAAQAEHAFIESLERRSGVERAFPTAERVEQPA